MITQLQEFKSFVSFLGEVLGDDVEVVLHDVTDLEKSVVAISETNLTGRAIGSPPTNLVLKILKDGKKYHKNYITNYVGIAADGTRLRSSTFFIRDEMNQIVGMLCINFNYEKFSHIIDYLQKYVDVNTRTVNRHTIEQEHLSPSIKDLAATSIKEIITSMDVPPDRMSQEEKMDVIRQLNENGVFLLKGIVSTVAKELSTSEASIYRYLGKMKSVR